MQDNQQSPESISVGILQPITGRLMYYGRQALRGFYSGLAYKGELEPLIAVKPGEYEVTIRGRIYELIVRDTEFRAKKAVTEAANLVDNYNVDVLAGLTSSSAAKRVIKEVVKPARIPLFVGPAAAADITTSSDTCDPFVFRTSENTAMDARSGGAYVANHTDISSVYLIGADYSYGKAVVENYKQVLEKEGITIVGSSFYPRGYSNWEPELDQIERQDVDGVVYGFTVATIPHLFSAFLDNSYSFRMFGAIASQVMNRVIGSVLEDKFGKPFTQEDLDETKLGPFNTRYHWNQYDNPINDRFTQMFIDAYGVVPDIFTSGTFTAASALVQAVNEVESTNSTEIARALHEMQIKDTPKGRGAYTFQPFNHQAKSPITIANFAPTEDKWKDWWRAAVMPSEPLVRISEDTVTIPESAPEMECMNDSIDSTNGN